MESKRGETANTGSAFARPYEVQNLPMEEYLSMPRVSKSLLQKLIQECPRAAWWDSWLNEKRDDSKATKAQDIGTLVHAMLLEGNDGPIVSVDPEAYVGVRGAANSSQFADVPADKMDLYQKHWWKPVHQAIRVQKTKWVVLRYPTDSFAQSANMSTPAFIDFYFDVCTADYAAMAEAQKPLVARMEAADHVRIVSPGTELEFSIKDIPVIGCAGDRNIPDGEVFTAPVRDSIQGVIRFNTQSLYQGVVFDHIEFEFKDGKIVKATANETDRLQAILESDEGARYTGEWSLGCNNRVRHPMLDTLFDEKIGGSFHLTPGQAYEEADNTNRSAIHWDLVLIQRKDYGGGEIYFDGELIRKDGFFVPRDLLALNEGL